MDKEVFRSVADVGIGVLSGTFYGTAIDVVIEGNATNSITYALGGLLLAAGIVTSTTLLKGLWRE